MAMAAVAWESAIVRSGPTTVTLARATAGRWEIQDPANPVVALVGAELATAQAADLTFALVGAERFVYRANLNPG